MKKDKLIDVKRRNINFCLALCIRQNICYNKSLVVMATMRILFNFDKFHSVTIQGNWFLSFIFFTVKSCLSFRGCESV